jgi:gliding motility-associated-like protein
VFIPNTFSPNADGANDVFFVRGSGTFQVRALRVYNRWGQLVFEKRNGSANNPSDGWDGTFNGQQLDAAAFVYQADVICRNGQLFTFKGSVSLIR